MFEDLKMTLEYWPIEKLIPYARNPRKNDQAVDKAASWIKEFGFRVPILAKSDGTIVDGHLRLKAAKKLGITQIPVSLADDMTEVQIKAFRLSVNKMSELADWDDDLLKLELEELDNLQYDIDSLGFDDIKIDKHDENESTDRKGNLSEKFGVPPFSVLNAREGWWQERKRQWLSIGIKSELGRGDNGQGNPGGGLMPACDYSKGQRGNSKGEAI